MTNPKADWWSQYNDSVNFDPMAKFPLNVDCVNNALLVNKLKKKKDFMLI